MTRALAATLFAALVLIPAAGTHGIKEGGTFRVATTIGIIGTIDPAFPKTPVGWTLLDPACATLMAYPDKLRPAGYRLTPSLAESPPTVSSNGRTYTFTIRAEARFSDGKRVTARAFTHAIERILNPALEANNTDWLDIVGAKKLLAGKATTLPGAIARGRTLTLRLTRPIPDLPARTALLCAVPPSLPTDPEGASAPLHSPAPYYIDEYVPGERLVLERNRFYEGERPHHVTRFVASLNGGVASVDDVASGTLDTILGLIAIAPRSEKLAKQYGVNKPGGQFFVVPGTGIRVFHLNTGRPLFRNNPKLRQAVNFAVDRAALVREAGFHGETPTDQYLVPGSPGHHDERIYPLKGPDLKRARALAKGHTRGGKAVLYTSTQTVDVSQAQILQKNLKAIGLELEIKTPVDILGALAQPGEPFDFARARWFPSFDPSVLNAWFDGRTIGEPGNINFSYFKSSKYNRLLDEASRLTGAARNEAYGKLDVEISKDAAPMIPVSRVNAMTFVSARTGCVVVNPWLDLTAVCLK